jgi:hypothetical protein
MPTFWTILTAVAPVLAPIVSAGLIGLGKLWWDQRNEIKQLKQKTTRHGRTLYGDDKDVQQKGLAQELQHVQEQLNEIQQTLDDMSGNE